MNISLIYVPFGDRSIAYKFRTDLAMDFLAPSGCYLMKVGRFLLQGKIDFFKPVTSVVIFGEVSFYLKILSGNYYFTIIFVYGLYYGHYYIVVIVLFPPPLSSVLTYETIKKLAKQGRFKTSYTI
jgi:hypothetical protein